MPVNDNYICTFTIFFYHTSHVMHNLWKRSNVSLLCLMNCTRTKVCVKRNGKALEKVAELCDLVERVQF